MKGKRLVVYLTALTVILQALVLPSVVVKADSTTWDTYNLDTQFEDCMWTAGAGLLHGSTLIKTRDYSIVMSAFWRFNSVNITNWGQVETAYLSVYRVQTGYNASLFNAKVYAIDLADDMGFYYPTGPITDPATRPLTSAYTMVNDQDTDDWSEGWLNITVTSQVIEVVRDQYAWAANNSLSFRLTNIVGADRYVRAFEYGNNTYGAKLYVERVTGRTYGGGWDNGELTNSTDWGDLWEVWNGTFSSGAISGYVTSGLEYMEGTAANAIQVDSTAGVYQNFDKYSLVSDSSGYLYLLGIDTTDTYLKLYRSTDGGDSWSILVTVVAGATMSQSGICINPATNVIHIAYAAQAGTSRAYKNYTIGTSTLSGAYTVFTGGSSTDTFGGIFYHSGTVYYVTVKNLDVGYYEKVGGVWTWYLVTDLSADAGDINADKYISDDGFELYISYKKNFAASCYGKYVDHDGSLGSEETITTRTLDGNGFTSVAFDAATGSVMAAYVDDTNDKLYVKPRTAGKAGSWGSEVLIRWKVKNAAIIYGTQYDTDGFVLTVGNSTTNTNKCYIYSSAASVLHTFTTIHATPQTFIPWTYGSEGTHYYQFHYYNCTWLPATAGPTIPANPWVPVADPDPDDYPDETGYLGRLQMRLYLIIIGLGLFVIPPIMWSSGRTELMEIGAGLIAMIFGVALLMASSHV